MPKGKERLDQVRGIVGAWLFAWGKRQRHGRRHKLVLLARGAHLLLDARDELSGGALEDGEFEDWREGTDVRRTFQVLRGGGASELAKRRARREQHQIVVRQ